MCHIANATLDWNVHKLLSVTSHMMWQKYENDTLGLIVNDNVSNFQMALTDQRKLQRYSFIPKCQCLNSFPSGVAPKSLPLADPCLPPVIQCSVLDGVQELVHIIPQHAPSTRASRASLLLPWGQRSNRGTEPQQRASSGGMESFTTGGWSLLVVNVCFSHLAGVIWMYVLRWTWQTKRCNLLSEFSLLDSAIYPETISES